MNNKSREKLKKTRMYKIFKKSAAVTKAPKEGIQKKTIWTIF